MQPLDLPRIDPMLAESGGEVPSGAGWIHEQKFDGVRALARARAPLVSLTTRHGHDKAKQFPEVARSLAALYERFGQPLLLDGEIVDAASDGYRGLQQLQHRLPMERRFEIELLSERSPAAYVLFDVLAVGSTVLLDRPLSERQMVLRQLMSEPVPGLRLSAPSEDGALMMARAREEAWEGLVSKRADSRYIPGQRTPAWRKVKLVHRQEFVVGGFTASDSPHRPFRALVVGYYDEREQLVYAGRIGTGFSERELGNLFSRLTALSRSTTPFDVPPVLGEDTVWVDPRLVVEVRFKDWSESAHLRDPTFIAVRSDKPARHVGRET